MEWIVIEMDNNDNRIEQDNEMETDNEMAMK